MTATVICNHLKKIKQKKSKQDVLGYVKSRCSGTCFSKAITNSLDLFSAHLLMLSFMVWLKKMLA